MSKRPTALAAVLSVAAAAALATPAQAAKNPYTATSLCGAGYAKVSTKAVDFPGRPDIGRLVLTRKRGTGYCAVVLKTRLVGTPTWTDVSLRRERRTKYVSDGNFFSYYAGPVYLSRPGGTACIRWRGSMHEQGGGTTRVFGASGSLGC